MGEVGNVVEIVKVGNVVFENWEFANGIEGVAEVEIAGIVEVAKVEVVEVLEFVEVV